jgi:signal transduction histidine kinase
VRTRFLHLPRPRLDPVVLDRMLAAVLTVGALLDAWLGGDASGHRLATGLVAAMVTASVAVRRRYPALVGTAVPVFATLNYAVWHGPQFVGYPIANLCALYALAVWASPRRFRFGLALILMVDLGASAGSDVSLKSLQFTVVTAVVMLLVRRVVGERERRAQIAERERDVAAREAVVEERARIARELHDVVAHHVSIIVVQAGAERRVLSDEHADTREVLETVERTGRSALTETRRLLRMLRDESADPLAPQPGLDDVPMLVEQLCEAGLPVELDLDGERRELPDGIDLSAYRIIQESLTNTLKHAGDARATVRVSYRSDSLELEIADDGRGGKPRVSGGGHGLVGMRERVALCGGQFDAGHTSTGGFVVRVVLPIR